jgi:hypothetical protein
LVYNDVPGAATTTSNDRRAWEICVLKAHGHASTYTRTHALDEVSRQALEAI